MNGPTLRMTWADLAFLHWRIPAATMRQRVPEGLELDLFDGTAWLGITPFEMRDVRISGLPAVPTTRDFPELNVRTYVRHGDRRGVCFFSLDAGSLLAVIGARASTGLPYFHARMSARQDGGDVVYSSDRSGHGAPAAQLRARYRPTGDVFRSAPDSLEHWLTERYSLFVANRYARVWRLDIEHEPWPLQLASVELELNTMADAAGFTLPDEKPHALFSRQLHVAAHWPKLA